VAAVGVPLKTPALKVRPDAGRPVMDQVKGAVPPAVWNCTNTGAPTVVGERAVFVVMLRGEMIWIESGLEAEFEKASAANTVKLLLPAIVGVPVIEPLEDKLRPGGKAPLLRLYVRGPEPPVALTAAE
jgi:hypothetical protein